MRNKHVPGWLKVTLGAFAALFAVVAVFGRPSAPPSSAPTASFPRSSPVSAPPNTVYTVMRVRGSTVDLADPAGKASAVRATGIQFPVDGDCFAAESAGWASDFLTGRQVTLKTLDTENGTLAVIFLPDGTDYSASAVRTGHATYVPDSLAPPDLPAAEAAARVVGAGLWGASCRASALPLLVTAAPSPTTAPATPPPPLPTTSAAPAPASTTTAPATCTKGPHGPETRNKRPCDR